MNHHIVRLSLMVIALACSLTPNFAQTVEEAQKLYERARQESTTDPEKAIQTYKNIIAICDRIGDSDAEATKSAAQRQMATAYYNWGAVQFGNLDLNGAVETFEETMIVAEKHGEDYVKEKVAKSLYKIYYQLGTSELESGRLNAALKACDRALSLNPQYAKAYYLKGEIYKDKDDEMKAITFLKKAIEASKVTNDNQTLRSAKGSIVNYLHKKASKANEGKEYEAALDKLKRALPYVNGNIQTGMLYFELALAYKGMNDTDQACSCFEKASVGHLRDVAQGQKKILNCD